MLIKKCVRVLQSQGAAALGAKTLNRIKYNLRGRELAKVLMPDEEELQRQRTTLFEKRVVISVVVPVYNTPKAFLTEMVESVLAQTYRDWELCIADAGNSLISESIVKSYGDSRIKYKKLEQNFGIAANTNLGVEMAAGEYVGFLDHDDLLAPNALFEVRKAIDRGGDFIYSDEMNFHQDISKPDVIHFKPDFSPFNLRGNNYICHFSVVKKKLFAQVGGVREGFEGSQDHDLFLRLTENAERVEHIPKVLYMWRIHGGSVAEDISAKPYCINSGILAVSGQLLRESICGEVTDIGGGAAVYRCNYRVKGNPSCRTIRKCSQREMRGCQTDYVAVVPRSMNVSRQQIKRLISIAALEGVGAVGGIGVCGGRVVSGAGCFDGGGGMETAFAGQLLAGGGYMHRLEYAQNVSCLNRFAVFSRKVFEEVGGFDGELREGERLADLCLRLRQKGYSVVLEPEVRAKDRYKAEEISAAFAEKHRESLETEDKYINSLIWDYIK